MRERRLKAPPAPEPRYKNQRWPGGGRPSLNLLLERPLPEARDQVWSGDITYIPTTKGWLYLAVVSGLCSLRIVGWVVAGHLRAGLVTHALRQALHSRRPACCGIHQSRSARANPYHDFWAESFMGTLETKMLQDGCFIDAADSRTGLFGYIESSHHHRRHSSPAYQTPAQFEARKLSPA